MTLEREPSREPVIRICCKPIFPIDSRFLHLKGRLHELKKGLFSTPKLSDLLHTGPKLEVKRGTLLAHINAP